MSAIALGLGVGGLIVNKMGADKQAKAVAGANAENDARLAKQDQSAWNAYLLSRGVNPGGAATGTLPVSTDAVNFKLPLYARATFTKPGATKTWRKKGSTVAPGTLSRGATTFTQPVPSGNPFVMPTGGDSGPSRTKDLLIGNPLGIGGKDRSFFDPLGIF